ncbi:MAG: non-canonical purine NTP pyrophosphatase [Defluviitaleaceae bacterium]|nr:non-canonical purine NTP pyrophosphatase [Defluviitaleaceae bacterium]
MKLVVATRNKDKVAEIKAILGKAAESGRPFSDVLSLDDIGLCMDLDAVEDGTAFEENAAKKAIAVRDALGNGFTVLADDSGLVVDALGGKPGVDSANFMGRDTPYPVRFDAILSQMPDGCRRARFICVMAVADEGGVRLFHGEMEGEIAQRPMGQGFGYDPIFYLPKHGKTAAQLTMDEKNAISHRGQALKAVIANLAISPSTNGGPLL